MITRPTTRTGTSKSPGSTQKARNAPALSPHHFEVSAGAFAFCAHISITPCTRLWVRSDEGDKRAVVRRRGMRPREVACEPTFRLPRGLRAVCSDPRSNRSASLGLQELRAVRLARLHRAAADAVRLLDHVDRGAKVARSRSPRDHLRLHLRPRAQHRAFAHSLFLFPSVWSARGCQVYSRFATGTSPSVCRPSSFARLSFCSGPS